MINEHEELAPYLSILVKRMTGSESLQPLQDWIKEVPLEKRYLFRIVAGLRLAFTDFDGTTVRIDRDTLQPEDVSRIVDELERRLWELQQTLRILKHN